MREFQTRIVAVHGKVSSGVNAYARRKVEQTAKLAPGPVLSARVTFDRAPNPAVERPALVQATLDVNGRLVSATAAGRRFEEAIDLLEARLRHRLEHLTGRLRQSHRRQAAATGARKRTDGEAHVTQTLDGPLAGPIRPRGR